MIPAPILQTHGLARHFSGFKAVDGVSLTVHSGAVHALIGPNGAGKSTLFNLITKALAPTAGRIVFKGSDITGSRPQDVARQGLVRSFQISSVFPHMTVRQNVRIALQRRGGQWFRFWASGRSLARLDARVDELLGDVALLPQAGLLAAELPYGRKRALELATTLALDPELLLLDEPMAGLGPDDLHGVAALIQRAAANRTVLMVEHNLPVVASLCTAVTVLARGRVLAEGAYAEVARHPEVRRAYMGEAGHA